MSMINARSIKNTLRIFKIEKGREPTFEEFRELLFGRTLSKKEKETGEEKE